MRFTIRLSIVLLFAVLGYGQVPIPTGVQILKAEDARNYDNVLEGLMRVPNAKVRARAALAAGRIGDDKALPVLTELLEKDSVQDVKVMAAFAIGEVESIKGADTLIKLLHWSTPAPVLARVVEAAGKIAGLPANARDEKAKALGTAILNVLKSQADSPSPADLNVVKLGLTAILRARPEGGETVVARFLVEPDARLRADAANTLTRLRAKNANDALRKMLQGDADANARANAARALGAAEDKASLSALVNAATNDPEQRVRVSSIRSLAQLKDVAAAENLMQHGEKLFAAAKTSKARNAAEKSELMEIATTLDRLLAGSANARATKLLDDLAVWDRGENPEFVIARFHIEPADVDTGMEQKMSWRAFQNAAALYSELAKVDPKTDALKKDKADAPGIIAAAIQAFSKTDSGDDKKYAQAIPDYLQAYAAYKPADLDEVLRAALTQDDVQIRATAAGLMSAPDHPKSKENIDALQKAFSMSFVRDKWDNDAMLAILNALVRLDKTGSVGVFLTALGSPDYLVRKRAFAILADKDIQAASPGVVTMLENARSKNKDKVLPYSPGLGTKLGQVLNTDVDYRRALSRKDGSVRALVTTEKGTFTIEFAPEEAPLTVDNWVKLARAGFFNGVSVHRVVPNFVMQDGDPRGDGNGGPGWSIRCEINMLEFDRGAVGMALSGKDTGGSQWFVDHSPQPHLDGGYTVFGHVSEKDMKVVDNIVRGDRIISVRIIGR